MTGGASRWPSASAPVPCATMGCASDDPLSARADGTEGRGVCDHARLAAQVFLEEVHGPLPGEGRGCLVIARGGVVVEAVLRARVGEHFVAHVIGVERRLEGRYAGVDAIVILGVVDE